jgi:hypothetical protein
MTDVPMLRLDAGSLLSKWGFNDGDTPEEFLDWCDEHGHREAYDADWHQVLRALVAERLLPVLGVQVELADIGGTSHNPVRASTWNGHPVEDLWTADRPALAGDSSGVDVPYADVLAAIRRMQGVGA